MSNRLWSVGSSTLLEYVLELRREVDDVLGMLTARVDQRFQMVLVDGATDCVLVRPSVVSATYRPPYLFSTAPDGRRRPSTVVGSGPVAVGTVSRMEHDDESISHHLLVYETSIGRQPTPTAPSRRGNTTAPRHICRRGQVTYDISATATSTWARRATWILSPGWRLLRARRRRPGVERGRRAVADASAGGKLALAACIACMARSSRAGAAR